MSNLAKLLDIISEHEGVSASMLERLVRLRRQRGAPLAEVLISEGLLTEDELFMVMVERLSVETVASGELERVELSEELRRRVPRELAETLVLLPLSLDTTAGLLSVAMFDPTDAVALSRLRDQSGAQNISARLAHRADILAAVERAYRCGDTMRLPRLKRCPLCGLGFSEDLRFCPEHAMPLQDGPPMEGRISGELTGHMLERRYLLGGVLGTGGMGTVYEARNLRTGKQCAVKVLRPELSMDTKMRRRLFREIQGSSQIRHPNVIEIYDYGEDERAGAFLVMELLAGRSLDHVLAQYGSLALPFCLELALQLCAALSAIHARGLVHCDLKPRNVHLLPSGRVKVLDFGLVKPGTPEVASDFAKITTDFVTFGTPHYMSPEQARLEEVDTRSDVYSLGVVIYEMLVGHPPFNGQTSHEILDAHCNAPVPLPASPDQTVVLPGTIEVLLLRMLAKTPDGRPSSVAEVAETLEVASQGLELDLAEVELGPMAAGEPPAAEPTRKLEVRLPPADGSSDLTVMRDLAQRRRKELVDKLVESLFQHIPHYRTFEPPELRAAVDAWFGALLDQIDQVQPEGLPEAVRAMVAARNEQSFSASELFGAFWLSILACRPLLRPVTGKSFARYVALEDQFDRRVLQFFLRFSEDFVAQTNQTLQQRSELLTKQNDELLELRNQLDVQLRRTHGDLARAEQVKARVADSITSGLVLVRRGDRQVLLFNKAAQRLSGLPASEVLGRPLTEIFHLLEGMPWEELVDQIRQHGQVGLRKLRVRFPSGSERTIFLRGEPFHGPDGEQTATLFVVEDVTERETIIESFSRYVSREVAQKILRSGRPMETGGEPREAVLLMVGIRGFQALLEELSAEEVVQLLDRYIRTVGNAVFHLGGVIDSMIGDRVTVYFPCDEHDRTAAARAAMELRERVNRLNAARLGRGKRHLEVGIGLHVGEVLVLNIGGRRRMVHTVLGDPIMVARALQKAARPGEILASRALAQRFGEDELSLEPGPRVRMVRQDHIVRTVRVLPPDLDPRDTAEDLDPPTLG